MVTPDSEFSHSDPTSAVDDTTASLPASAVSELPSERIGRLLVIAAVAGLAAGVVSELIGELILNSYHSDLNPPLQMNPNAEDMRRWREARLYSATLTFSTLGGLLGLALGLAGGFARRSTAASAGAANLGLVLGSATAGSFSLILVSIFFKGYDPQSGDLLFPLLTHGAIWSAVGAVGGLAFGLGLGGRGRWKATLVGGFTGAAAATIVYELVGAVVFASSKTDLPLSSSSMTRGMALLLVACLSSIGAVLALHQPAKREARSSVSS
jgi:vacuolar-type H+-ATPase subunit I/STV1